MNLNDIVALANAGFTKAEIAKMITTFGNETEVSSPATEAPAQEAPVQEAPVQEAPVQEAPAPENNFDAMFNNLNNKIDTLANAVYSSNIANSRQPKEETSEDVFKFMFGKDDKK